MKWRILPDHDDVFWKFVELFINIEFYTFIRLYLIAQNFEIKYKNKYIILKTKDNDLNLNFPVKN